MQLTPKEGYKVGIVDGQSASAQRGFDQGYRQGAEAGLKFGETLGQLIGISKLKSDTETKREVDELIKEGGRLSEKVLKPDEIEEFQRKCKSVIERMKVINISSMGESGIQH